MNPSQFVAKNWSGKHFMLIDGHEWKWFSSV